MPTLLALLDVPPELRPETDVRVGELIEGTPIGDLIAESARANAAKADAEDQTRREQMLATTIDTLMVAELEAEMRAWPSAQARENYRREFAIFRTWCTKHGLGALPAKGSSVAAYFADSAANGADKAWFPIAAAAIRHIHSACHHYLDDTPIAAALKWAAKLDDPPEASGIEPQPTQH